MVHLLQCSNNSVHILFFVFFSILILTSSMEVAFSESDASRRLLPQHTGGGTNNIQEEAVARSSGETTTTAEGRRALTIGSRPPRCERVCMSCGHCEAVQVPIVPREKEEEEKVRSATTEKVTLTAAMFTYRVDGITNYKPLSWKCRCGGTILDP